MIWKTIQEIMSMRENLYALSGVKADGIISVLDDMLAEMEADLLRASLPCSDAGLSLTH